MRSRIGIAWAVLLMLASGSVRAAQEPTPLPALELVPKDAIAFCHIPSLKTLEKELDRFREQTGWQVTSGATPIEDLIANRTGLREGLDWDGPVAVAYLDPKQFPNRYTVYVLPVADWGALLKSVHAEEMAVSLYALTGTSGPRFLLKRGRFAVVTSSVRTMDAVRGEGGLCDTLSPETRARAAGAGLMVRVDVHRLVRAYENEILLWMRAATGQVVSTPQAAPFNDVLVTYILGLTDFLDQVEVFEAALRFEPDGLAADMEARFLDGGSVARFLASQKPGPSLLPPMGGTVFTSCVNLQLDPETRTAEVMRATQFFLEKAPRPQPLTEKTKRQITEAIQMLMDSLGPRMVTVTAPAAPGMGMTSNLTLVDLKDPEAFKKAVALFAASWEGLADELNLYMSVNPVPGASEIAGVPVDFYVPRFRYGLPARHLEFLAKLRDLYGPEGLTYRVAVVGQTAVIATGSDLTLFRNVIEGLKKGEENHPPALEQFHRHVADESNISIFTSLPLFFRNALLHGGMSLDRIGTVDPGKELAGLSLRAEGNRVKMESFWPHEQLRLSKELLDRVAPAISEGTESLFAPSIEGPPAEGATTPPAALPAKEGAETPPPAPSAEPSAPMPEPATEQPAPAAE